MISRTNVERGGRLRTRSRNFEQNCKFSDLASPKNGDAPIDPELVQVTEVWDTLPPGIREAILAMLRAVE